MISSIIALASLYWYFIVAYVAGGTIYAVIKWTLQILKLRRKIVEINSKDFPETNNSPGDAFNNKTYLRNDATSKIFSDATYPPKASNNKARLFSWATFWPANLVYTLFADVIREAWNYIYEKCGAVLDQISKAILPK